MVLDCNKYRLSFKDIQYYSKNKKDKELIDSISMIAIATNVPIIIVCYYIGELYGFDSILKSMIQRLRKFYHVKQVLNSTIDDSELPPVENINT